MDLYRIQTLLNVYRWRFACQTLERINKVSVSWQTSETE